jgi:hypothetical protein
LYLIGKLDHGIYFLLGLLPFFDELFELGVHSILSTQERVDEMFLDWEASFDRFLSGPIFAVGFALDEYLRRNKVREEEMGQAEKDSPF